MSTMQERWVLFCAGQHPQRNLSGIVEEFVASEVRLAMAPKESSAQLAACERWALGVVDEPDLLRHTTLSESTTALRIIADELTRLRYENARLQSEVHAKAEPAPSEDRAAQRPRAELTEGEMNAVLDRWNHNYDRQPGEMSTHQLMRQIEEARQAKEAKGT
jgi:hypothetical protein